MMRRNQHRSRMLRVPTSCYFCKEKIIPDYTNVDQLRRFVTERGKISGQARTGICHKHQRLLTIAIKRARILALLPFVAKLR
ncbi:MAG: 30S ribosomal protein S18 [Candidatus Gottesmanbacteria bacterium]